MNYNELKVQDDMTSPLFQPEDSSLLLSLRTRTVRGIRSDFGDMYRDKSCPLCPETCDSISHLLECPSLQTSQGSSKASVQFSDVFSDDILDQKAITTLFARLLQERGKLLESTPNATSSVLCINLQNCDN